MAKEINVVYWKNEDPATPVLIHPLMEDCFGPINERTELVKEAIDRAEQYCIKVMNELNEGLCPPTTMGELEGRVGDFINGYISAKTGTVVYE